MDAIARAEQSNDIDLPAGLSRREFDVLAFERQWWNSHAGAKEDAIKELFSMSATRYYQVLNAWSTARSAGGRSDAGQAPAGGCVPPVRRRARPGVWALIFP